jgi:hypothetical protein
MDTFMSSLICRFYTHTHTHTRPLLFAVSFVSIYCNYKVTINAADSLILCHVDPLLGSHLEIRNYTTAVTRQGPVNCNRRTVFIVRLVPDKLGVSLRGLL